MPPGKWRQPGANSKVPNNTSIPRKRAWKARLPECMIDDELLGNRAYRPVVPQIPVGAVSNRADKQGPDARRRGFQPRK